MCRWASLLALAILVVDPGRVCAQAWLTGAEIRGSIADETGSVLDGATVTATNAATGVARTALSDANGRYLLPVLPPGTYDVTAEKARFIRQTLKGVQLVLGQSAEIPFTLRLAGLAEQVTVTSEAPAVDVRRTSVAAVVEQEQIDSLPINGRNFIAFSVLGPGVSNDRIPQQQAAASETSGLSFAGQRARSNNVMVDGLDNNDAEVGSVRRFFSQEAVREFQVLTSSYSAEFGRAAGGVVNIVTKSGTNELHGSAFLYFRDDGLNAKDHFEKFDVFGNPIDRAKAPFKQNQYGATLGGPLRKDRTFFFLSGERIDVSASNFVNIDPAAAAALDAAGFPVELGAVPYDYKVLGLLGRLDHQWSPTSSVVFRFDYSDITDQNVEPYGGLVARSRGAEQLRTSWSASLSQTNILGARWVSEARIQVSRQDRRLYSLDPACDGICDTDFEGGPTVEIAGVASAGRLRTTPRPRLNHYLQVTETVSHVRGDHLWKAGVDFNVMDEDQALPLHFGGRFIFSPLPVIPGLVSEPLTALQAFSAGLPAAYVQGYGAPASSYDFNDVSVFLQDEWRVTPRLTVKPGIRYQRQSWPSVAYDISDVDGSRLRYSFPRDNDNFAPRIAASFDLIGDGKGSLHAAYGVFFDNHIRAIASITDVIDGSPSGVRTLVLGLPGSIAAWRAPDHRLPEPVTAFPSLQFAIDPSLENPFARQASLGIDRELAAGLSVSADFVLVRGRKQLGTIDYNPRVAALGPGRRPDDVGGRPGTSASVLQYTTFGETWYRGLMISLNHRLSRNYQFTATYTLSKAEDNSTDFQSSFIPQDNGTGRNPGDRLGLPLGFDPDAEKGPSIQDQRHRFVLSGLYRFPYGVQFSTIVTAVSGRPYTPLAGFDWNGDGDGGAFPSDRARRTPGPIPSAPFDSVGRNSETTEKQVTIDARLSKQFRVGGKVVLEAIVEAFNLLNRVNFIDINAVFGRGAFPAEPQTDSQGRVTYGLYQQALPPRQVQLALKFSF